MAVSGCQFQRGSRLWLLIQNHPRLNLDLGIRIGYLTGKVTEYVPQCGRYVCTDRYYNHYFGPTGIDITLVWFPGKGKHNNPDYGL